MFAQLVDWKFVATPEQRAEEAFAAESEQLLREQPGCLGVLVFGDDTDLYSLSVWQDRALARNATKALADYMGDEGQIWWLAMSGPPVVRLFDLEHEAEPVAAR